MTFFLLFLRCLEFLFSVCLSLTLRKPPFSNVVAYIVSNYLQEMFLYWEYYSVKRFIDFIVASAFEF